MSGIGLDDDDWSLETVLTDDQVEELTDLGLETKALSCHFELNKGLDMEEGYRMDVLLTVQVN